MKRSIVLFLFILQFAGCSRADNLPSAVAFGDSNTQEANWAVRKFPANEKWVNLLSVSEKGKMLIYNEGIGGQTTEHARKRFMNDVINRKPKVVFIMFGTNDALIQSNKKPWVSKERYRENLLYFIHKIRENGGKPVLMTCLPVIEGTGADKLYYYRTHNPALYLPKGGARNWHNSYNSVMKKTAKEEGVLLIDNWSKMVKKAGGATDKTLIESRMIDSSGYHMTPKGARLLYENIKSSSAFDSVQK
ncbi:SGNH/GDSL hydrolase family protein [Metabacillus sp. RGM 3146]|uniref:SGNH/GDSL hydrolase family protein n=1 Tax=Metabacillus sp. RGM 3146 TaxID=3401092 RepID=UPI003B99A0C8